MKAGRAAAALIAALIFTALPTAFRAEGGGRMTVPGTTVTSQEELFTALGGDDTCWLRDSGIFIHTTVNLESPVVLDGGEYFLDGDAGIKAENSAAFELVNGAKLTVGIVDPDRAAADSVTFDGDGGTYGHPAIEVGVGCTLSLRTGVSFSDRINTGSGGAIYCDGVLNVYDGVSFSACRSLSRGGAIYCSVTGKVGLAGGVIKNCSASDAGGAVYSEGELALLGTQISGCGSEKGGAVFSSGRVTLAASAVENCTAVYGGAVYSEGELDLTGGLIQNCSADRDGGGVYIASAGGSASSAKLTGTYFDSCSAAENGGTVYSSGTLDITGGTQTSGSAARGGGVFIAAGSECMVNGGVISLCTAELGGGIFVEGKLTLGSGSLSANKAGFGTAVFNYGDFHVDGFPYLDRKYDYFLVMNPGDAHPLSVDSEMKADTIARITAGTFDGAAAGYATGEGMRVLTGEYAGQGSSHFVMTQSPDGREFGISEGTVYRVRSAFERPYIYIAAAAAYVLSIALVVVTVRMYDRKRLKSKETAA